MISVFSNTLGQEELEAVAAVFESRWLGSGKEVEAFEREFALSHLGVDRILLFNSCTSAIYAGLEVLGIGPVDEVIVSTVNFVAVASAVVDLGAEPVFADVHPWSLNILPEEILRLKTPATKAVIILHYGGHPAPMDEIKAACGDILLVEDAANAVASTYKGRACGTIGDMGVWSFDAMKILVMGDGGALYLRDPDALERARSLRFLGLAPKTTSGMDSMVAGKKRWWEYDLVTTSGNHISNDIMASVGRVQLEKLPGFIARRKKIWDYYQREFELLFGTDRPPEPAEETTSSYYLYWLRIRDGRDELAHYLAKNGVYTTFRYYPLHLVRHFYDVDCVLPNAEAASETVLNLPLHQNLSDGDVNKIVDLVKKFTGGSR